MPHHAERFTRRPWRAVRAAEVVVALLLTLGAVACGSDHVDRDTLLVRTDAQRLVGAWEVTMTLDRPLTHLHDAQVRIPPVAGTAAFTANRHSELYVGDFGIATHKGAFDVDLTPFNLPLGEGVQSQSAVARTGPLRVTPASAGAAASTDSVSIALIPDDTRLSIRMLGVLSGDTVTGSWVADFLRAQASGQFAMRRHTSTR